MCIQCDFIQFHTVYHHNEALSSDEDQATLAFVVETNLVVYIELCHGRAASQECFVPVTYFVT